MSTENKRKIGNRFAVFNPFHKKSIPEEENKSPAPSDKSSSEDASNANPPHATPAEPEDYIIGFKLVIVNTAVTLVAFLMLLDTSIVSTVS